MVEFGNQQGEENKKGVGGPVDEKDYATAENLYSNEFQSFLINDLGGFFPATGEVQFTNMPRTIYTGLAEILPLLNKQVHAHITQLVTADKEGTIYIGNGRYFFDDGIEPIDGLDGFENPPPISPLN